MNLTDGDTKERLKVVVLYGGDSPEHEVSRTSGLHAVKSIDLRRYETHLVAIDKSGLWYEFKVTFRRRINPNLSASPN
ncbi:MAG: hypothetical protein Ct9H90mP30_3240 [Actinomycetota bacterium]|nr:MAG: hypothetical protein Ct9H90mP30_3240 [Actinomycetota bacterium]